MSTNPHWDLRFLNKRTDEKGQVGVAWNNDDGSIRIRLNTAVVLQGNADHILTLFPPRDRQVSVEKQPNYDKRPKPSKNLSQEEIDKLPF